MATGGWDDRSPPPRDGDGMRALMATNWLCSRGERERGMVVWLGGGARVYGWKKATTVWAVLVMRNSCVRRWVELAAVGEGYERHEKKVPKLVAYVGGERRKDTTSAAGPTFLWPLAVSLSPTPARADGAVSLHQKGERTMHTPPFVVGGSPGSCTRRRSVNMQ